MRDGFGTQSGEGRPSGPCAGRCRETYSRAPPDPIAVLIADI